MPPSSTTGNEQPSVAAVKPSSGSAGVWSDLPRRATVLLVGIPTVGVILSWPLTSWLFFQGVHLLSAWEWLVLVPPSSSSASNNHTTTTNSDSHKKDDGDPSSSQQQTTEASKSKRSLAMYIFPVISCALANVSEDGLLVGGLVAAACLVSLAESRRAAVCNHLIKGLLFLTLPMRAWNRSCQDFAVTSYLLSVVWNCDTGALVVGRLSKSLFLARHIPPPDWLQRISPAKSVEGILGGLLFGGLTSAAWPFLWKGLVVFLQGIHSDDTDAMTDSIATGDQTARERLVLGLMLSVLGIVGDLWESSTKRQGGVKDSGKLLPGHGGILDRFDSSLLPVLFYNYIYN